ncbi:uncharacterized protein LOC123397093 [Hordeum vulgare subsp. vulgare]|uniref:uncharacterized protein LOC123397093 n=1 Tax=Hordeum vulgare subsp. vulgare TaxID=112509 RepID=UPI001D1A40B6|nr:uncharacterized protein LOC123397093 [Hordeum vulgare subsp. vulgare]
MTDRLAAGHARNFEHHQSPRFFLTELRATSATAGRAADQPRRRRFIRFHPQQQQIEPRKGSARQYHCSEDCLFPRERQRERERESHPSMASLLLPPQFAYSLPSYCIRGANGEVWTATLSS